MPPKKQNKAKKSTKGGNAQQQAIVALEKKIARLSAQPRPAQNSNVTDFGKMLLTGGNMLGSIFGVPKIFGSGAYKMSQNTMFDTSRQVPIMHSESEKIIFRHREYIGDVTCFGVAYAAQSYSINPGLSSTFPYLSEIAANFQEYKFRGLVFSYHSTSAESIVSGTNTQMGSVMLAAQYRSDAPAFTNKQQMLNEMWSVDTRPSNDCTLPIECDPKENTLGIQYVRTGAVPSGSDVKTYDLCNVTVATAGFQSVQTNVIGELWASYEVELYKPVQSINQNGSFIAKNVNYDNTHTLRTDSTIVANTLAGTIPPGGNLIANAFRFPDKTYGTFLVTIAWAGSGSVTISYPNPTFSNGVTLVTNTYTSGNPTSVGVSALEAFIVTVDTTGNVNGVWPTIGFVGSYVLPTSPAAMYFSVTQVPAGTTIL